MSDDPLAIALFIGGVIAAPIAFIVTVRKLYWVDGDPQADSIGYALMAALIAFAGWWVILALGVLYGIGWLMLQAAKPGRIKLAMPRRRRLQDRIDELEAELGMRGRDE